MIRSSAHSRLASNRPIVVRRWQRSPAGWEGIRGPLEELFRPELETMQQVLLGYKPESPCPPAGSPVKKSLFEVPASLGPGKGDHLAELSGPLKTGSMFSEDFLLEYANRMTGQELGWGRVNETKVRERMGLHAMYADMMRQTPYIARARASNLLSHI